MAAAGVWIGLTIVLALSTLALAALCVRERRRRIAAEAEVGYGSATRQLAARAEAVERARARFYQDVLNALPIPVWRRADDLTLLYANDAYALAVGAATPAEALLHKTELGGADARSLARRSLKTGAALSESRVAVIGEDRRLIEVTERPLGGGGLVGDGRDVTSLAAAQDAQSRLIEAHAEVLERVGSAIAVFTAGRQLAFFNAAFTRLFGFQAEQLADISLTEMLENLRARRMLPEVIDFPAYKAERMADFQSLLEAREEYIFLPNGRTLKETSAPHPQGGLIFIYDDVSDRLALERSYRTLDRVQRQTLDALQEGIAVFGEDGRLRLSNPAFDAVFRSNEQLGREPHVGALADAARSVLTPESWRTTRDDLVSAIVGRATMRIRATTRTGCVLDMETLPLADGGVLVAIYDVTDSHAVEQALRERAQALEAADRLKSEFLGIISYELRTPLTTILGFADMLRAEAAGPVSERQAEYLDDILAAANAFIDMVDDIIDVAAIEAGQASLERASTPAADAIGIAATEAASRIAPLPLNIAPMAEPGLVFNADPDRLRQILVRLLTVAGRYARDAATVRIDARSDGDWAMVTVTVGKTSGRITSTSGIEPARTAGASLDLTLASRLAQAHGGELIVERAAPGILVARCRLPRILDSAA